MMIDSSDAGLLHFILIFVAFGAPVTLDAHMVMAIALFVGAAAMCLYDDGGSQP